MDAHEAINQGSDVPPSSVPYIASHDELPPLTYSSKGGHSSKAKGVDPPSASNERNGSPSPLVDVNANKS